MKMRALRDCLFSYKSLNIHKMASKHRKNSVQSTPFVLLLNEQYQR
jgi:hypothetical protein